MELTILIIICIALFVFCFIKLMFGKALKTTWRVGVALFGWILVLSCTLKVVYTFSDLLTVHQMSQTTAITTMTTTTTTTLSKMNVYVCGKCGEATEEEKTVCSNCGHSRFAKFYITDDGTRNKDNNYGFKRLYWGF